MLFEPPFPCPFVPWPFAPWTTSSLTFSEPWGAARDQVQWGYCEYEVETEAAGLKLATTMIVAQELSKQDESHYQLELTTVEAD